MNFEITHWSRGEDMRKSDAKGLSAKEIKKVGLEILTFIDGICSMLGIQYCLAFGTLLGAIRHNGFIPWDDDIDIWMKREDFNLFRQYFYKNNEVMFPYYLCDRVTCTKYEYYIPRICDLRYEYYSIRRKEIIDGLGVFVDVYPIDSYGANKKIANVLDKKINRINSFYAIYADGESYSHKPINRHIKRILHTLLNKLYGENYRYLVNDRIELLIKTNTSPSDSIVGIPAWETYHIAYPKNLFDEFRMHVFCDRQFPVPNRYDEILKMTYGDYMVPPPESKRIAYHEYEIYKKEEFTN